MDFLNGSRRPKKRTATLPGQVTVTTRQRQLLEIETARMRHAWAKAEVKRGEPSAALVTYLQQSRQELRALRSLVAHKKAVKR
jgi:hypothetical protein